MVFRHAIYWPAGIWLEQEDGVPVALMIESTVTAKKSCSSIGTTPLAPGKRQMDRISSVAVRLPPGTPPDSDAGPYVDDGHKTDVPTGDYRLVGGRKWLSILSKSF